eukprot:6181080-Pleurochrysis_carterae.AAC.1
MEGFRVYWTGRWYDQSVERTDKQHKASRTSPVQGRGVASASSIIFPSGRFKAPLQASLLGYAEDTLTAVAEE